MMLVENIFSNFIPIGFASFDFSSATQENPDKWST
jgi:hypothetical protein